MVPNHPDDCKPGKTISRVFLSKASDSFTQALPKGYDPPDASRQPNTHSRSARPANQFSLRDETEPWTCSFACPLFPLRFIPLHYTQTPWPPTRSIPVHYTTRADHHPIIKLKGTRPRQHSVLAWTRPHNDAAATKEDSRRIAYRWW